MEPIPRHICDSAHIPARYDGHLRVRALHRDERRGSQTSARGCMISIELETRVFRGGLVRYSVRNLGRRPVRVVCMLIPRHLLFAL